MLVVRELRKTFPASGGAVAAVRDVSFEVARGQTYTLLGPSGCGKTTTLRCIAGLERLDGGEISLDGAVVDSPARAIHLPPWERPVGMVFQSYAIWPHLSVFANVAYPLQVSRPRPAKRELEARVMEALRLVKMEALAARPAPQLSGGQQQRVALARALVGRPKLLLLDEPLSNLDAKLREQMRDELRSLVSMLGITSLYVTHDQLEALALADRIAVMAQGRIIQEGPPREIYGQPRRRFVADFVGTGNFIEGRQASGSDGDGARVKLSDGSVLVCGRGTHGGGRERVVVLVRPEDVLVSRQAPDGELNVFAAEVEHVTFQGSYVELRARTACGTLNVRTHAAGAARTGERVFLRIPPEACTLLDAGGEP